MNSLKVSDRQEARELMEMAIFVGQLLIQNGAEIYRAEDTVQRICESRQNIYDVDVFCLTSAIFVSLEYDYETITLFKNIGDSSMNLEKIDILNEFSRTFVKDHLSIQEGRKLLRKITEVPVRPLWERAIFAGLASAFFNYLSGGGISDFFCSLGISAIVYVVVFYLAKFRVTFFIENFIGAFLCSALAISCVILDFGKNLDAIVIGCLMILVPGVAITNAVRDIMSGDFLSGLIGLTKAIFAALAIALGVGVVLNFQYGRGIL